VTILPWLAGGAVAGYAMGRGRRSGRRADKRREGVFILTGGPGDIRAARGLVGRAIRKVLGVKRWGEAPYFVIYSDFQEEYEGGGIRRQFTLYATDDEFGRVVKEIYERAPEEGWLSPPIDPFHYIDR